MHVIALSSSPKCSKAGPVTAEKPFCATPRPESHMTRRSILVLAISMMGAATVQAQGTARADSGSTVITSGQGEITLSPDRGVLRVSVETRAGTAAQAANANTQRVRKLLDTLNSIRQPNESVMVAGVSVHANRDDKGQVRGYAAIATVRVSTRTLERLGTIIDAALAGGANNIQDVTWLSDREESARREALGQSFAEARQNAQVLADAARLALGPLLTVSTEPTRGLFGSRMALQSVTVTGHASVPLAPQDVIVRASVEGTWRLVARQR